MAFANKKEMELLQHFLKEEKKDYDDESSLEDFDDAGSSYEPDSEDESEDDDISFQRGLDHCGTYVGKDKRTVWQIRKLENILTKINVEDVGQPGPKGDALKVSDPLTSWKVFFDEEIIEKIVYRTNLSLEKVAENYARKRDCKKTDTTEIRALIGLLYLSGLYKSSHTSVKDLWATDGTGIGIFHTTMAYKRFFTLLRHLCFHDMNSSDERASIDNLTPIRELFETFIKRCQESYDVGKYVTIDEKLDPYKGGCEFRQYMNQKRRKCGIKVYTLVDSCTLYSWNMEIHAGDQPEGPFKVSYNPKDVVKRLMTPLFKSGCRNLTANSWCTSYSLAKDLLSEGITLVGEVKKFKEEIPRAFFVSTNRKMNSTIFGYQDDTTLMSYCSKKRKCIVLLSTMHDDGVVDETSDKSMPEALNFNNFTKGAVNTVEEMSIRFSTSRITDRWPTAVFFSMLNTSAINARIILLSTPDPPTQYKSRRQFLKTLGLSLVSDYIEYRKTIECLPLNLREKCTEYSGCPPPKKICIKDKGRCYICPRNKDRKTRVVCFYCMKLICGMHQRPVCVNCAEEV